MAIAFVRANPISRQKGQSVVASAAYRACEKLYDERREKIQDYTKKGGHVDGGLILPDGVKLTREELWNAVEAFEKRIDARLSKEILVALPKELSVEENIALSKDIAALISREQKADGQDEQYCVDWNIHEPHQEAATDEDGNFLLDENGKRILENNDNIHLHILATERAWDFDKSTFKTKKDRDRNSKEWMENMKLKIGELINMRLREKEIQEVDFRSFDVRNEEAKQKTGKELEAPQVHHGPEKTNLDRKRRRRINRTKRNLKNVKDELSRIQKKEKESAKLPVNRTRTEAVKTDFSAWTRKTPEKVEKSTPAAEVISSTTVNPKKQAGRPKIISVSVPAPVAKSSKPAEVPKSAPVSFPVATGPGTSRSGSVNQNQGPKVRCLLCGVIEYPECKKCKFRDKENEISNDSGYSR
jgi:hypothetical protein